MVYKVGDKVRIKSIDWYNENKDKHGKVACGYHLFTEEMSKFCGSTMIVCNRTNLGVMTMGGSANYWTDEMIEGLAENKTGIDSWDGLKVELELSKSIIGVSNVESLQGERFMAGFIKAIIPPKGYQFKDDKGNIINTTKIILEEKSDI